MGRKKKKRKESKSLFLSTAGRRAPAAAWRWPERLECSGEGDVEGRTIGCCTARGAGARGAIFPCTQSKAAMLPSLQESVDGDEKELESSEEGSGFPEEPKPERSSNSYYCLYGYQGCR